VRYWDASAIVPVLALQSRSSATLVTLDQDRQVITWWGTRTECVSALARLGREGNVSPGELASAFARLEDISAHTQEIAPTARLRQIAERMLRVHPLRTGDALQLAAAVIAADGSPATLPFVTLDERLARAAEREGFPVIEPA
jgi:predicted nucleic acid-binding protein